MKKSLIIILLILIADQVLKFWIKLNMSLGQEFPVFDNWFIIHFTENKGMAFGLSFGGEFGKLALSLFRLVAILAIGWYLSDLIKKKMPSGLILSITLVFAGALGNLIDSAFYGMIFSHSSYHSVATLFPEGGGYSSFLHGKVVDMFYFPVIQGYYPDWVPFWGGNDFIFFRPVFNIADSSITVGVLSLILFQRKYFTHNYPIQTEGESQEAVNQSTDKADDNNDGTVAAQTHESTSEEVLEKSNTPTIDKKTE